MNNNPMRDVIEQMKASAQREGKQQTSSVAKAAMEKQHMERWQIAEIGGDRRFLLYHFGEDQLFHYVQSLATESDVQDFVRSHGLALNEDRSSLFVVGNVRIFESVQS